MTERDKIALLIKKHYKMLEGQAIVAEDLDLLELAPTSLLVGRGYAICYRNLEKVLEACRKRGYGDLVDAFEANELINTEEKVRLIFKAHPNPIKFIAGLKEKAQLIK